MSSREEEAPKAQVETQPAKVVPLGADRAPQRAPDARREPTRLDEGMAALARLLAEAWAS